MALRPVTAAGEPGRRQLRSRSPQVLAASLPVAALLPFARRRRAFGATPGHHWPFWQSSHSAAAEAVSRASATVAPRAGHGAAAAGRGEYSFRRARPAHPGDPNRALTAQAVHRRTVELPGRIIRRSQRQRLSSRRRWADGCSARRAAFRASASPVAKRGDDPGLCRAADPDRSTSRTCASARANSTSRSASSRRASRGIAQLVSSGRRGALAATRKRS
jgi:hypothetical protein